MKLKISILLVLLFIGGCSSYNENIIFNSTIDTINVEISGYSLKNMNTKIGVSGLRLPSKEKIAFRLSTDTLLVNINLSTNKIPFKYDMLEIFIYTPNGIERGPFISAISDTLFFKNYPCGRVKKSNIVIDIDTKTFYKKTK